MRATFTGLVAEVGEVAGLDRLDGSARLRVRARPGYTAGESVAVDGVCLTVCRPEPDGFTADVMAETLRRCTLDERRVGDAVNLERAVAVGDRLGGHLVQGHVDGTGVVTRRSSGEPWDELAVAVPDGLDRYIAEKGSIAVDGVSLTVVEVGDGEFRVGLIPTTLASTTLGRRRPGDRVNLEVDVLAKYVERLLAR